MEPTLMRGGKEGGRTCRKGKRGSVARRGRSWRGGHERWQKKKGRKMDEKGAGNRTKRRQEARDISIVL